MIDTGRVAERRSMPRSPPTSQNTQKTMTTSWATRAKVFGVTGFGLGHALIWVAMSFLESWFGFESGIWAYAVLAACAGALGCAILSQAGIPRNRRGWFILAGSLGQGSGTFLAFLYGSSLIERVQNNGPVWFIVMDVLRYAAVGLITGGAMGGVSGNWRTTLRMACAGAIGFGMGWLLLLGLSAAMGRLSATPFDPLRLALNAGLSGAILGVPAGLLLGWAMERGVFSG